MEFRVCNNTLVTRKISVDNLAPGGGSQLALRAQNNPHKVSMVASAAWLQTA